MRHHVHLKRTFLRVSLFIAGLLTLSVLIVYQGPRADGPYGGERRTVRVHVVASDSAGLLLSYRWRSTDGFIRNVNAPSTTWTLPNGPGLHFAYVLVSNGSGGYTERRVAVNTDSTGGESQEEEGENDPRNIVAPPAPAQQGDYFRSYIVWGTSAGSGTAGGFYANVYVPDAGVTIQDTTNTSVPTYPLTGPASTDAGGQFIIPGFPSGADIFNVNCALPFAPPFSNVSCGSDSFSSRSTPPPAQVATTEYYDEYVSSTAGAINGSLTLQDGNPCGTQNEFFGVHVSATATLLDSGGNTLAGPVPVNTYGYYALPALAGATTVQLQCEQAAAIQIPISGLNLTWGNDLGTAVVANVTAPTVTTMSATWKRSQVGIFLPPPSGFPSDDFPRSDQFLAIKGLDSRLGACQYYMAVGAVKGCDSAGNFYGAATFDDWKRTVKIGKYATGGATEYVATYVNKIDLNLTRNHHSISYGPNQTAAVVCNYLGPPGSTPAELMNPAQSDIDTAVDNALENKNLVACVAMDYSVNPGVNNDQPFVRYLIFGPDDSLLPSINLDGRREKFVPGTCVVCHGGDHYAGKFPEDGSGFANVGAHFLPYDVGNFEFSSKPGLTKADQEQVIYLLNQNILNAGPTQSERDLLAGWYKNGQVLDESYLPSTWVYDAANPAQNNPAAESLYQNVVARSCRTCHVALGEYYNFDHQFNYSGYNEEVCGVNQAALSFPQVDFVRFHSQPNSLVTFNRFWLSGSSVDQPSAPNQTAIYNSYNVWNEPSVTQRCVFGNTP